MKKEILPGKYLHYKGNTYIVLALATHSETLEKMVVYYPEKEGKIGLWVRPESMFHDEIKIAEGRSVLRFTFIEPLP